MLEASLKFPFNKKRTRNHPQFFSFSFFSNEGLFIKLWQFSPGPNSVLHWTSWKEKTQKEQRGKGKKIKEKTKEKKRTPRKAALSSDTQRGRTKDASCRMKIITVLITIYHPPVLFHIILLFLNVCTIYFHFACFFYNRNIPMSLCKLQTTLLQLVTLLLQYSINCSHISSLLCFYIVIFVQRNENVQKSLSLTLYFLLLFTFLKGLERNHVAFTLSFRINIIELYVEPQAV